MGVGTGWLQRPSFQTCIIDCGEHNLMRTIQNVDTFFNCTHSCLACSHNVVCYSLLNHCSLEGNNIACDGARSLSEALRVNETLEELE